MNKIVDIICFILHTISRFGNNRVVVTNQTEDYDEHKGYESFKEQGENLSFLGDDILP